MGKFSYADSEPVKIKSQDPLNNKIEWIQNVPVCVQTLQNLFHDNNNADYLFTNKGLDQTKRPQANPD